VAAFSFGTPSMASAASPPISKPAVSIEFFNDGAYHYAGEGKVRSIQEQGEYLQKLCEAYPIVTVEDGNSEDDWDGWKIATDLMARRSSSLATTSSSPTVDRLRDGIMATSRRAWAIRSSSRSARSAR
jgi:enolase